MDTLSLYSIKDLNSEVTNDKLSIMGIICKSFVPEPRKCKSGGKYFMSFTVKGMILTFLGSIKSTISKFKTNSAFSILRHHDTLLFLRRA